MEKKPRIKRKKPLFNKDVEAKKIIVDDLQKKHDELNALITMDYAKIKNPPRNVMEMIDTLSIQSLGDSFKQDKFLLLKAMNERDKILKKNNKREEELNSLKHQIEIARIEFALAKVYSVAESVDKK